MLVAQAVKLGYRSLVKSLTYWAQLADPEGTERSAQRQHVDRHLHLSEGFGGGLALDGFFDPTKGAVIANALDPIGKELFEADWAQLPDRWCGG